MVGWLSKAKEFKLKILRAWLIGYEKANEFILKRFGLLSICCARVDNYAKDDSADSRTHTFCRQSKH